MVIRANALHLPLADESVHVCATSIPYYGLRCYGISPSSWEPITYAPMPDLPPCVQVPAWTGTLGNEPSLAAYVGHVVQVFREVRRVLRRDGTLWLNVGDSHNADGRDGHGAHIGYKQATNRASATQADWVPPTAPGLQPTDLCEVPSLFEVLHDPR
jgi:DNA modification methylase